MRDQQEAVCLLQQLEKELEGEEEKREAEGSPGLPETIAEGEQVGEEAGVGEQEEEEEEESRKMMEAKLLHEQDSLLHQV